MPKRSNACSSSFAHVIKKRVDVLQDISNARYSVFFLSIQLYFLITIKLYFKNKTKNRLRSINVRDWWFKINTRTRLSISIQAFACSNPIITILKLALIQYIITSKQWQQPPLLVTLRSAIAYFRTPKSLTCCISVGFLSVIRFSAFYFAILTLASK